MDKDTVKSLLARIFSGEDGKKFNELLRNLCDADRSCFNENPQRMAYNEGKRDVYIMLMTLKGGK